MGKSYVIVDELICEEEFLRRLYAFLIQTKSSACWFRVMRKLKELLEVEKKRSRKVKNTLNDFNKLREDINALKIKGEYWIKNDNLDLTVNKIMNCLN